MQHFHKITVGPQNVWCQIPGFHKLDLPPGGAWICELKTLSIALLEAQVWGILAQLGSASRTLGHLSWDLEYTDILSVGDQHDLLDFLRPIFNPDVLDSEKP